MREEERMERLQRWAMDIKEELERLGIWGKKGTTYGLLYLLLIKKYYGDQVKITFLRPLNKICVPSPETVCRLVRKAKEGVRQVEINLPIYAPDDW